MRALSFLGSAIRLTLAAGSALTLAAIYAAIVLVAVLGTCVVFTFAPRSMPNALRAVVRTFLSRAALADVAALARADI